MKGGYQILDLGVVGAETTTITDEKILKILDNLAENALNGGELKPVLIRLTNGDIKFAKFEDCSWESVEHILIITDSNLQELLSFTINYNYDTKVCNIQINEF